MTEFLFGIIVGVIICFYIQRLAEHVANNNE